MVKAAKETVKSPFNLGTRGDVKILTTNKRVVVKYRGLSGAGSRGKQKINHAGVGDPLDRYLEGTKRDGGNQL